MRHRPRKCRRPSHTLRIAAAATAAVPVLALAPAALAASGSGDTPGSAGQPNLVVSELPATAFVPGTVRHDSVTLTNNGTAPADGVAFRIRLTRGLDFPGRTAGCTYTTTADQVRQALCHLGITIAPGASATVPLPIKVLSKALMEAVEYGTGATGGVPGEGYTDSYRRTSVQADSSADLAAVGDRARGRAGHTVTVTAALRNNGPGWVRITDSDDQPALMVKIPPGTVAVRVPAECDPFAIDGPSGPSEPGKPQYVCSPSDHTLEVGSVHRYTFKLKILKGTQSTSGEVKATSVYDIHPAFDHNAADDSATVSVTTAGHGPGTDSASTASPAPGASTGNGADGAHATTDSGHSQARHSTTSDTAPASDDPGDDTLANTGADTGTGATPYLIAAGVGAAGLGGTLALVAARRRRAHSS